MRISLKHVLKPVAEHLFAHPVSILSIYTRVPPNGRRIPNTVFQTWKEPSLPWRHARAVRRFRRLNRDYSFIFYDDRAMAEYMERSYAGHPILEIFRSLRIPASRADVWRYCILFREGGIYCDIDSALTVPFRVLLKDDPSEMISFEGTEWSGSTGIDFVNYSDPAVYCSDPPTAVTSRLEFPANTVLNWLLCFEKESPILREIIDLIVRHADFFRGKRFGSLLYAVTHFTGPPALTQAVWKYIEKSGRRPAQCGIDFRGQGIFKLPGEEYRYRVSPHYATLTDSIILR